MATISGHLVTGATSADFDNMRDWLLDCFDDEYDQDEIKSLRTDELLNAIDRYFDGGLANWDWE